MAQSLLGTGTQTIFAARKCTGESSKCASFQGSDLLNEKSFLGASKASEWKQIFKSLRTQCPSGAAGAQMVAATSKRGAEVEFETSVFKKEKINLAGREEVHIHSSPIAP